jgi:glycosyltransferase involved in cell wall biosynthesis
MAAGRPVVVADKPFAREACGDAALYADEDSAAGFARHVEKLVADPALRARMAARGRQRFATINRSWDAVATRYVELLRECVATPRAA